MATLWNHISSKAVGASAFLLVSWADGSWERLPAGTRTTTAPFLPSDFHTRLCPQQCFGVFPGLHEFEAQKNHEVDEFRAKMRTFCEEKAQERQLLPWLPWMEYNFPCELEPCCSPVDRGGTKSQKAKILVNVKFEACDVSRSAAATFPNVKGRGNASVWDDNANSATLFCGCRRASCCSRTLRTPRWPS